MKNVLYLYQDKGKEILSTRKENTMFMFNRYDCTGTEYVCLFKNGTHHVIEVDGYDDNDVEVFTGHYDECAKFVDTALAEAEERMW